MHIVVRHSPESTLNCEGIHLVRTAERHAPVEDEEAVISSLAYGGAPLRRVLRHGRADAVHAEPLGYPAEQRKRVDILEDQGGVDKIEFRGGKLRIENVAMNQLNGSPQSLE